MASDCTNVRLEQGKPYFHNYWHKMAGPDGRPFLRQMTHANAPLALPDHPVLTHLVHRRIITQTADGYSIEVLLVWRWLAERSI